ncbi:DMT family transporter [Pseudoroseomonas cervicalis]|uniref:Multidrug resistance protein, SMR family n=1 Tax=Pseudoroseomonas cervicalis ATCC 49957 TaxID=525371 RepID=D5RSS7_9PROT|nr:SMR family transporter [Pseudoroseomonas cervicalis]EFH09641.1 multidrug resistance protein, SMR family [Pseudoroseomonas cervicalis ATCC 49957]
MLHWLVLAAAITTSLVGQVLLKAGTLGEGSFLTQLFRWQTIIGLGCYGGAAMLYIVALRKIPMSVALPCTAASYVIIALIGHFMFGEALGPQKVAAIGLISLGVALLATA